MFSESINDSDVTMVPFLNQKMTQCLTNHNLKQMIINHLLQNYNIRFNCTNKYFRLFDQQTDLQTLKKYKHLAYINTNQNINLIALFRFNNQPFCLYIDKLQSVIYLIKSQFSPSLYDGSIFEGELIETENGNYFLISDFLVYKKKDLSNVRLDNRLTLLNSIFFEGHYTHDPVIEPFKILTKDFIEYSQMQSFIDKYLPTLPYKDKISGLIFRPVSSSNKNLIYNFQVGLKHNYISQIKTTPKVPTQMQETHKLIEIIGRENKQVHGYNGRSTYANSVPHTQSTQNTHGVRKIHNTESITNTQNTKIESIVNSKKSTEINHEKYTEAKFLLFETGNPDDYILKLIGYDGNLFHYGYALINDMKTSQYFQKVLSELPNEQKKKGICVICQYNSSFKKWKPYSIVNQLQPDNIANLH